MARAEERGWSEWIGNCSSYATNIPTTLPLTLREVSKELACLEALLKAVMLSDKLAVVAEYRDATMCFTLVLAKDSERPNLNSRHALPLETSLSSQTHSS